MVFICDQCGVMFDTEKALVRSHINPFHLLPEILSAKRNELQPEGRNFSNNSLFKSFSEQLHLNNISLLDKDKLRDLVVKSLNEKPQIEVNGRDYDLCMFINESSWESYLLRLSTGHVDGDHIVLQRLCQIYNVQVEIVVEGRPSIIIEPLGVKDVTCTMIMSLDSSNNFTSIQRPVSTLRNESSPSSKNENIPYDVQDIQATLELRDSAETEAVTVLTNLGIERNAKELSQPGYNKREKKQLKKFKRKSLLDAKTGCVSKKIKVKEQKRAKEPKVNLFKNDAAMPYFRKDNSRGMTALDVVNILLDQRHVTCSKRPFSCKENAVFLVKLSSSCLFEDVTFDDMTWLSSGRRTSGLVLDKVGDSFKYVNILPKHNNTDLRMIRAYRKNSSNENFRCIISYIKERESIFNSLVLIQYYFIGPPSLFTIRPHGNSKTVASFKPTKPSTKRLLKELLQVKPPGEAVRQVRRIVRGDDRKNANCDLPLGKQQAYDMNRRKRKPARTKV